MTGGENLSMEPIKINKIIKACDGELFGGAGLHKTNIEHITIDAREAKVGSLYIPVKGEVHDGHKFIPGAFSNGAVCTLSERKVDFPHIRVGSTFKALKDIAEYYRSKFDIKVVAITGSVGKTTAKDMIASVLSKKFSVLKTKGNLNNEFGLPRTLFELEKFHEVAVLEMGMNSFGEISRLSKTARPDICVIINIGVSHIGNLGSRDGILKAKSEIFDYMKEDGKAYLFGDDDKLITLKGSGLNPIYFGFGKENQAKKKEILKADIRGTEFIAEYRGEEYELNIPYPGEHILFSALAAVAIGKDLGMTKEEIASGVADFSPSGMRMEITETEKIMILDDAYNACPESIMAGLGVLGYARGRKIAVLGDILELGEHAEKLHFETGEKAACTDIDLIICVGELSKHMYDGAKEKLKDRALYYKTQDDLQRDLSDIIKNGDTVLVKASRGLKFEKTVEFLKKKYE